MIDSRDTRSTDNRSAEEILAGMMTSAAKTKLRAGDTQFKLTQPHEAERNTPAEARTLHHNVYEIYAYTRAVDEMRPTLGREQADDLIASANSHLDGIFERMPKSEQPEGLAMEVKPSLGRRKDYSQALQLHKSSHLYVAKPGVMRSGERRLFTYAEIENHFDIHEDWK